MSEQLRRQWTTPNVSKQGSISNYKSYFTGKTLWSGNRNDIRHDQKEQLHKGGGDLTDENIGRARPAITQLKP